MTNLSVLQTAMRAFGVIFCLVYPLFRIWPSGWQWSPSQGEYELMIVGVYAVLGVMLFLSASDPLKHSSLIWFTVWSSAVHGLIMLLQAFADASEQGHLLGDIPALFLVALVLGITLRKEEASANQPTA